MAGLAHPAMPYMIGHAITASHSPRPMSKMTAFSQAQNIKGVNFQNLPPLMEAGKPLKYV
jgi:hypothetical protein